jgi:hypothetical protein
MVQVSDPTDTCRTVHEVDFLRENPSVAPTVHFPGPTEYPLSVFSAHFASGPIPERHHPRPRERPSKWSAGSVTVGPRRTSAASTMRRRIDSSAPAEIASEMVFLRASLMDLPATSDSIVALVSMLIILHRLPTDASKYFYFFTPPAPQPPDPPRLDLPAPSPQTSPNPQPTPPGSTFQPPDLGPPSLPPCP